MARQVTRLDALVPQARDNEYDGKKQDAQLALA